MKGDHVALSVEPTDSRYGGLAVGSRFSATPLTARYATNAERIASAARRALAQVRFALDEEEFQMASRAIDEAVAVVGPARFGEVPWVDATDSGALTIQWQHDGQGIILVFSGDGMFALSTKTHAADRYVGASQEHSVADGLPDDAAREIRRLSWRSSATAA